MRNLDEYYTNLKNQTNNQLGLYLFCCSICVIWTVYVVFFNSRLLGSIITFFLNFYLKRRYQLWGNNAEETPVWIKIRSISISFLSGKIMFRGIHYVTIDYMLYIQDGWITFAYWRPQYKVEKSKKTKTSHTSNDPSTPCLNKKGEILKRVARLEMFLCNFQLHYYNSWKIDEKALNKTQSQMNESSPKTTSNNIFRNSLFATTSNSIFSFFNSGFSQQTHLNNSDNESSLNGNNINSNNNNNNNNPAAHSKSNLASNSNNNNSANNNSDYNFTEDLMQLFSVVNIRILKGRIFAGNSTLPTTLTMRFSSAKLEFVTEKSQSKVDDYCFILRGDLSKLEISLIPNKKMKSKEIPLINNEKKLENRILMFRSAVCDFEYVQDVPSILTFDRRYIQKSETGELIQNEKEPQWSLAVNCHKHTILNYGPWFDRQREILWKYFFPPTYEELEPHPEPTLNERRQTSKFDFIIKFKDPNTELNLTFSSNSCYDAPGFFSNLNSSKEVNENLKNSLMSEKKISFKCNAPSQLECSIPWLTKQYGYKTTIVGEFNSIKSSTNLSFDKFLVGENLKLNVDINYPLIWNELQTWNINVELQKGSTYFVFYHKNFFQDLINDWSSRVMGDLRHFVPYVYKINFHAKDIEVILPCNQHNWIDTVNIENNSFFAVLARDANVKFDIPFEDFQSEMTNIALDIKIADACARFIVPPTNKNLTLLKILRRNIKYISFHNQNETKFESNHWSQFNPLVANQTSSTINRVSTKNNLGGKDANKASTTTTATSTNQTDSKDKDKATTATNNNNSSTNLPTDGANKKNANRKASSGNMNSNNAQTFKQPKSSRSEMKQNKSNNVRFAFAKNENETVHMQENWIECWQTKSANILIKFDFYLCPVIDWNNNNLVSVMYYKGLNSPNFDCEILKPDLITLQIEIGPSQVMMYGTFLKRLWYIKEALFSWDQYYTEMVKNLDQALGNPVHEKSKTKSKISKPHADMLIPMVLCNHKDPRNFRPLSVVLSLAIHQINGCLVIDKGEGAGDVPLPIAFTDRLIVELDKSYKETRLQLFIDPVNLFVEDLLPRKYDKNLFQGHLCLSNVQLRGHAMFSDEQRLKTDTLEYAWLLEILLGDLTGTVTPVQLEQLVHGVETFVMLLLENDYQLQPVFVDRVDPGLPFKYEVVRFSLDLIDLYLVECATALNFNLHPIRVSTCNSHTKDYAKGLSAAVGEFNLKLFINEASRSDASTTPANHTHSNYVNNPGVLFSKSESKFGSLSDLSTNMSSSISSISISSLNSSTFNSNLDKTNNSSQKTLIINNSNTNSPRKEKINLSYPNLNQSGTAGVRSSHGGGGPKIPDSNEFNYWFECSSLSSGVITIDLALDQGFPEEQMKFLRLHDFKTRRLYFLWNAECEIDRQADVRHVCGCVGGCYYYSVFDETTKFAFFDLKKSINRTNANFGRSLFHPDKHVLQSQTIMMDKYDRECYEYNAKLSACCSPCDMMEREIRRTNKTGGGDDAAPPVFNLTADSVAKLDPNQAELSRVKSSSSSFDSTKIALGNSGLLSKSLRSIDKKQRISSSNSVRSNREDDYFTADEDDEENDDDGAAGDRKSLLKSKKKKNTRKSSKSIGSSKSKLSYFSLKDSNNQIDSAPEEEREEQRPLDEADHDDNESASENEETTLHENMTIQRGLHTTIPSMAQLTSTAAVGGAGLFDAENKMDLNFDIKRPILDSSLPKYCYLKYLSRAYVHNWNRTHLYPCYEDTTNMNINFNYRQKGINYFNISSSYTPKWNSKASEQPDDLSHDPFLATSDVDKDVNCRINLKFSVFECYITPLLLTGLGRFMESLKDYKISPNSLITQLQTKAHAHSAANAFKEAISKTQVSLKIPQIRFFSLQCGLAEGDKISNAFANTLANPDEFITLSLSTLCIYSIETQLIDSQSRTAAIFMIDKIDTQFCRLYDPESIKKLNLTTTRLDESETNDLFKIIKLSCISDDNSKTSIRYFQKSDNASGANNTSSDFRNNLKNLIMYECAFDRISIKAIKKINDEAQQQPPTPSGLNDRISICEFDISKIWFSFPEPPTSPKGKRKIPFSRYDWNLLSSVSPAVISWLCAYKNSLKPLEEYLKENNKRVIQILASLIAGSLKNKEQLEAYMKHELLNNKFAQANFKSENNFSSRFRNKVTSSKVTTQQQEVNEIEKYLQVYLTSSSYAIYRDPNCRLVDLIRNYFFYFPNELTSDLECEYIPDVKYLKRGINELLNSWSLIIMNSIDSAIVRVQNEFDAYGAAAAAGGDHGASDGPAARASFGADNFNDYASNRHSDHFKFFTEIRENRPKSEPADSQVKQSNVLVSLTNKNAVTTQLTTNANTQESIQMNRLNVINESTNSLNNNNQAWNKSDNNINKNSATDTVIYLNPMASSEESVENYAEDETTTGGRKTDEDVAEAKMADQAGTDDPSSSPPMAPKVPYHSGHVGPQLKNTSKIFKPILNFIGIDAPSGTVIDNLFKEFGSLLFGNLNIKSVHINILGSVFYPKAGAADSTLDESQKFKYRSFYRNKTNTSTTVDLDSSYSDKIITTILSFDDLLFSVNVRQVLPESPSVATTTTTTTVNTDKDTKTNLSMVNPVYVATAPVASGHQMPLKYHTKIDAGIRINTLTQEVNMPLLRLVHQIYSIIADAIEYDKEQNKLNSASNLLKDADKNTASKVNSLKNNASNNQLFVQPNQLNRDCWKYMAGLIELRDFIPEPKFVEKGVELKRNNSQKAASASAQNTTTSKYVHITKDSFIREKTQVSFFGWLNVRQIHSKAVLGTLALSGEMKNIQMSTLLGRKLVGHGGKLQYEGSVNVCMDSTFGKLTENDSRQNVVQLNIGKSHMFGYLKNLTLNSIVSSFVHIGHINIDVPLRPMIVHGVVYRESKVIEQKILPEIKNFAIFENADQPASEVVEKANTMMSKTSTTATMEKSTTADKLDSLDKRQQATLHAGGGTSRLNVNQPPIGSKQEASSKMDQVHQENEIELQRLKKASSSIITRKKHQLSLTNENKKSLFNRFVFQLKSKFDGIEIRAKLLETPCLKASYLIKDIECNANITNERSKLTCLLTSHCLSFQCDDEPIATTMRENATGCGDKSSPFLTMKPLEERTNLFLPSVSLNGSHLSKVIPIESSQLLTNEILKNSKSVNLTEMQLKVKISQLSRELNAEVIAQLVFVTKVFLKELNYILQAVYGLDNTASSADMDSTPGRGVKVSVNEIGSTSSFLQQQQHTIGFSTPTYFFYDIKVDIGKISLTGITPSNTALSVFSGDKSVLSLTNNNLNKTLSDLIKQSEKIGVILNDYDHTMKPSIEAKCNLSVELKTSLKSSSLSMPESNGSPVFDNFDNKQRQTQQQQQQPPQQQQQQPKTSKMDSTDQETYDWYQLAYFNTKFELRNAVKTSNSGLDRESIIINVEKPRFYLQPGSVDSAILFWLNYKSTYEFWLQQRQQFSSLLIDQELFRGNAATNNSKRAPTTSPSSSQPDASSKQNINNFLTLKLRVTGLGLALPLSNKMTKDFFTTSADCLVITLNETAIYACSSGCVVSKGQFSNFCLRFSENFYLGSSEWAPPMPFSPEPQPAMLANKLNMMPSPMKQILMNAWVVPFGNYEVCSSTIELTKINKENINNTRPKPSPIWILSVKWKMEGIEVNLDTNIGKWLSKLADTVTRLAETQNINMESSNINDHDMEIKKLKKDLITSIEKGDSSRANLIQSRLDLLNLASYPEKAKQIFVKTRNNLKGQLGFNSGQAQTPIKLTGDASGPRNFNEILKMTSLNEETLNDQSPNGADGSNFTTDQTMFRTKLNTYKRHSRTRSADSYSVLYSILKSVSNDDLSVPYFGSDPLKTPKQATLAPRTLLTDLDENERLNTPERARQKDQSRKSSTTQQQAQAAQIAPTAPAIDFKLNVKIEINSGKCVLHANKSLGPNNSRMKSDNFGQNVNSSMGGFYGNTNDASSSSSRGFNYMPGFTSSQVEQDMRNTNFIFPAIGVKAFYESTHKKIDARLTKKANLYAMIKLESFIMPTSHSYNYNAARDLFNSRDMCISPALLDFLEQTLEPLDLIRSSFESSASNAAAMAASSAFGTFSSPSFDRQRNYESNDNYSYDSENASGDDTVRQSEFDDADNKTTTASDSTERRKPNQMSGALENEVDAPVAYFPVDVVVFVSMLPSSIRFTCLPHSTMECLLKLPSLELVFSTNRIDGQTQSKLENILKSDDSKFINKDGVNYETTDFLISETLKVPGQNSYGKNKSNLNSGNEGGLNVTCSMTDFSLKFYNRLAIRNPFETRFYYNDQSMGLTEDKDSLSVRVAYIKVNISRTRRILTKMLAAHYAEYPEFAAGNKSSLNDVKLSVIADIGNTSFVYDMRNIKEVFVFPKIWYRRSLARRLILGEESTTIIGENGVGNAAKSSSFEDTPGFFKSSNLKSDSKHSFTLLNSAEQPTLRKRPKTLDVNMSENSMRLNPNWKTLVLISVNLVGFEIKMNVGNVMGNVHLLTKNARAISKMTVSRLGPKDAKFNFSIDNTRLIADGGSNACLLRIQDITASVEVNEKNKNTKFPWHKMDFSVYAAECRIDSAYNQASPILAFRLSNLNLKLNDNWETSASPTTLADGEPKIPESLIDLNVTWDQMHLMITRSTTPDLVILYYKLVEFLEKQFSEGKDYIRECELDIFYEVKVKQQFVEKKEPKVKKNFNVTGGNIQLKGNNFTLITFHGNSFKAIKWAVFSLNEPSMDFGSQTCDKNDILKSQQNLSFYLGRSERKKDMASIYMVYRDSTSIFTKYQTISEWFEYAHSTIDAVGLRDFPRFSSDEHPMLLAQSVKKSKVNDQTKWEEIFHLPSLQIFYDTTQEQSKVRFEFKTDFHDHIQLTFRTELFGFLHELITSYIKETDLTKSKEPNIPNSKKDERDYECVRWELEPTLRLISKFGSSVEPLGVDALLKSLGFHHARSTIPKWLQRGLLDNLNEVMHALIKVYIKLLADFDPSTNSLTTH